MIALLRARPGSKGRSGFTLIGHYTYIGTVQGGEVVETMKAVRIHSFGGPQALKIEELPRPPPGEDEILVQVKATSVNPVDYKIREAPASSPSRMQRNSLRLPA